MSRTNIYRYPDYDNIYNDAPVLEGWFDLAKASAWDDADWNGNGTGGVGRSDVLYLTSGGKWVLSHRSAWQDETSTYEYVTSDHAREWLLRNGEDAAVAAHFGPVAAEEDRRPGRPPIGEAVNIRLGDALLARVDERAAERGESRAEAIRGLVSEALAAQR